MTKDYHLDTWLDRACHLVAIGLSVVVAFLLRFDFAIPASLVPIVQQAVVIAILVKLPVFGRIGFCRTLRRFVSTPDLYAVLLGNVVGSILFIAVARLWIGSALPRSVLLIDALLCFVATGFMRFSVRFCNETWLGERSNGGRKGIVIYGAGTAGAELVHEIHSNPRSRYLAKGFLDDDPAKKGALIMGVPVLGSGREASSIVRSMNRRRSVVEEIVIAIPSASGAEVRQILANCHNAQVPCKTVPSIEELISGKVTTARVRSISVQDLLGRQPVKLDQSAVQASIAGRSVLITGAAGSIGSELCRQVASFKPACLIAFDQAESELFRIGNEIRETYPEVRLVTALGDIRDTERLTETFERHEVESVFHAAAYKHVPLMESHVTEAVLNNIIGTWNLVLAARSHKLSRLLMISSDKAVNPICVMGATKRVCEKLVSASWEQGQSKCGSVRFGNVLGSSGSVVPIFQAQIAAGGPIRVTHPDARRYFMTIAEAVSLVMQASTQSQGSEIFILDMGEPIRIVDLAETMIRLAGLVPHEDIAIQFTGLRPGEKVIEELNGDIGTATTSFGDKIQIIREQPLCWDAVTSWISELQELLAARQELPIIQHLQRLVPEYMPALNWKRDAHERVALTNGAARRASPLPSLPMPQASIAESADDGRGSERHSASLPPFVSANNADPL